MEYIACMMEAVSKRCLNFITGIWKTGIIVLSNILNTICPAKMVTDDAQLGEAKRWHLNAFPLLSFVFQIALLLLLFLK